MTQRTLVQCLVSVMIGRGKMSNRSIYQEYKKACAELGIKLTDTWEAGVREMLQAHCPECPQWNGRDDFFVHESHSYWSCKLQGVPGIITLDCSDEPVEF